MTVDQFIVWLQSLKVPDAVVLTWDPDRGESVPVTGAVFNRDKVELQTDIDSDEVD